MARVLIVGCGCRGRELAAALIARGHAVRGTTRDPAARAAIEAAGAESVQADPDRLMTLVPALEHTAAVVLLLGSAAGSRAQLRALHGPRLGALLRAVLDTTVRAIVYEASGTVPAALLEGGAELVARECARSRIPFALARSAPGDGPPADVADCVERLLSAGEASWSASRPAAHGRHEQ